MIGDNVDLILGANEKLYSKSITLDRNTELELLDIER